jgi:hypothetical protein
MLCITSPVKKCILLFILFSVSRSLPAQNDLQQGRLKVSANGHFLKYENGKPFFWLGDTGWELFSRLNKEEIEKYLENRRKKGFNVIQSIIIANTDKPLVRNRMAIFLLTITTRQS